MKWLMLFMSIGIYFLYYAIEDYPQHLDIQPFPFSAQKISPQVYIHYGCGYIGRIFCIIAVGLFANRYAWSFIILTSLEIISTVSYFCRYGEYFLMPGFDTMSIKYVVYLIVAGFNIVYDQTHINETT